MSDASYESLRENYRPEEVRLLLIGESPPDPRSSKRRFFYAPELAASDNLFRGVVAALYGHRFPRGSAGSSKEPWLHRLRMDGVFLVDLVPFPVNSLSASARAESRRRHVEVACQKARGLRPEGIIVCHKPTFGVLRQPLVEGDLPLLHDEPIPFPLGNRRREFVERFRRAAAALDMSSIPADSWATTPGVRRSMLANRSRDTGPERRLRSELHRLGLRFRKDSLLRLQGGRVRPDIAFSRARVAVFVDGCFWHRCPEHASDPKANSDYWGTKLEANVRRDRRVDALLRAAGWEVVRVWEHEAPLAAARRVAAAVAAGRAAG